MCPFQERLATVGLPSFGRMESHVISNLTAVIDLLRCALGKSSSDKILHTQEETGASHLESNTNILFGKPPSHRCVRVMVTIPSEAADDYSLIKKMLVQDMDCVRINCAHDAPETWDRMIEKINLARRETGRHCRILMDLGGPKLRRGDIAHGEAVLKWKPRRDKFGNVVEPAQIGIHSEADTSPCAATADACLPVEGD